MNQNRRTLLQSLLAGVTLAVGARMAPLGYAQVVVGDKGPELLRLWADGKMHYYQWTCSKGCCGPYWFEVDEK